MRFVAIVKHKSMTKQSFDTYVNWLKLDNVFIINNIWPCPISISKKGVYSKGNSRQCQKMRTRVGTTVPSGKTQRSWFAVWLAVSPFRIMIGWKIWGVPKNLGNFLDDGHWNFPIWTQGSWENGDKRFQLAFWNLIQIHLL